mmetsp:Transcript_501/g.560  ORF Transcript_501/g.560 Transcript_501/m.560 type:complete len:504 (-) Transcript_501:164-1675(-)|eukprot:CAMPEP_0197848660 /NCGR_PEP_ID=MMETSP1438-20131217/9513_1 /TAXON_ID=1461541 /ORGANISM="Pterosperma sp., Strain CCMP1384" /LENGTH=503 /DNA_ID=CAMNT_0043461015 /DNA_START=39 /DNA_END=1550 /DNA_ORIENTATION=+
MLRTALQQSGRLLSDSLVAPRAACAVQSRYGSSVALPSNEPGFFASLFGAPANSAPSMREPLTGVETPPEVTYDKAPVTEMTTLSNGVRIVSENTPGPTATVGVYIDVGSKYENPQNGGVTHFLERTAFKDTAHRTHLSFTREAEAIGANFMAAGGREQMSYTATGIKTNLPQLVELLADTALYSKFTPYNVQIELAAMARELKAEAKPELLVNEWLHQVAYKGGLGQSYLWNGSALDPEIIVDFVEANHTGPRVVIAASGVEHKALVGLSERLFADLPATAGQPAVPSQYEGGDHRVNYPQAFTQVLLGFEVAGGWRDVKNSIAMSVMVTLMGGGSSFSAGGPGKGMHSRLYTRVLQRYGWMEECTMFQSIHNDTGLAGIAASCSAGKAPEMLEIVQKELRAIATKGAIGEAELERAKKSTVSNVLMALESSGVVCDDMGRQILTFGQRISVEDMKSTIEKITANDIAACAAAMLKSKPTLVSVGPEALSLPPYAEVCKAFA